MQESIPMEWLAGCPAQGELWAIEPRDMPRRGRRRGRAEEWLPRRTQGRCTEGGQGRGHVWDEPPPKGQVEDLDANRHLEEGAKGLPGHGVAESPKHQGLARRGVSPEFRHDAKPPEEPGQGRGIGPIHSAVPPASDTERKPGQAELEREDDAG